MKRTVKVLPKGYHMEELLRNYFLKAGYYVARGVPFKYEGFDITDVDLWLYNRISSVSREVTIVDCKNKKTPQAIERIFWIHGLKIALEATSAIVATTDKRQEVKDFGKDLNIVVLDGNFMEKLKISDSVISDRFSDEEFENKIKEYSLNKIDGDWLGRMRFSKSLLSSRLSFDTCNSWLIQASFFAEQVITKQNQRELALRCLYILCSYVAIGIDYCMKEISFLEQSERSKVMKDGFTYGSKGSTGISKMLNLAIGLIEENSIEGSNQANELRNKILNKFENLNTNILAEYFSKNDVSKNLFNVAIEFEQIAMNKNFVNHNNSSIPLRSMLGCLLDHWKIDRSIF